jgi:NTE family protein
VKVTPDEFDKPYFPSKGWAMDGFFKLVTDNGWNLNGKTPVILLGFTVKGASQISERLVFLPSFQTQFTLASEVPVYYRSFVGGFQQTNYFGTYLPFAGLRRMELIADNVALIRLDLRLRMWEKVFASLITNLRMYSDQFSPFMDGNIMIGGGVAFSYNSVVGPIEFSISTSNLNNKITPYFSLGYTF